MSQSQKSSSLELSTGCVASALAHAKRKTDSLTRAGYGRSSPVFAKEGRLWQAEHKARLESGAVAVSGHQLTILSIRKKAQAGNVDFSVVRNSRPVMRG